MLLKHAREPIDGQSVENTFEAIDERTGALLANCVIYIHENEALYPNRPLRIYLSIEGETVPDILLGAAVARAKDIAYQRRLPSRIFTEVDPEDADLMELLKLHGFMDNDGLVLMQREIEDAEDYRLPAGCVTVMDNLDDPIEQKYFLDRYNMTYNEQFDFEWLQNFRKKPGFKRILIVSPTGMVGETVVWHENGAGRIGWLFVAKKWREMGVSATLMKLACVEFRNRSLRAAEAEVQARMPRILRMMESAGFYQQSLIYRSPGMDIDPQ